MLSSKYRERLTLSDRDLPLSKVRGGSLSFELLILLRSASETGGASLEVHEIVRNLPSYPPAHVLYQLSTLEAQGLITREPAFYPLRSRYFTPPHNLLNVFISYQELIFKSPKLIPLPEGLFVYQADIINSSQDISIGRSDNKDIAKLACMAEAYERDTIRYRDGDTFLRSLTKRLDNCLLPSDIYPSDRDKKTTQEEDYEYDWLPATNLLNGELHWVPAGLCLLDFPEQFKGEIIGTDSTGCATGISTEQAIKHALLEVIERDAAAIWWYAKLPCPEIAADYQSSRFITRLKQELLNKGYLTRALNITNDLGVPVVATVAWHEATGKQVFIALGCDLTLTSAVHKSFLELMQRTTIVLATCPVVSEPQHPFQIWLDNEHIDNYPQLKPQAVKPVESTEVDDINQLIQHLSNVHLYSVYAVNLTRDSLSPPVVRVFIPKLCSLIHYKGDRLFNMHVALQRGEKKLTAPALESKRLIL